MYYGNIIYMSITLLTISLSQTSHWSEIRTLTLSLKVAPRDKERKFVVFIAFCRYSVKCGGNVGTPVLGQKISTIPVEGVYFTF